MLEFVEDGCGFAIHDKEVDNIFEAFTQSRCANFVYEVDGKIVGGVALHH